MSIDNTLNERGARYGDFTDHARIAQDLQDVARSSAGWHRLNPAQRQSLTVICDKIARILSGDPNYSDNWHDIQGYAKLVEDRLPRGLGVDDNHVVLPVVELPASMRCGDAINVPPLKAGKPWYPDDGDWKEVPPDLFMKPEAIPDWQNVEVLSKGERERERWKPAKDRADEWEWGYAPDEDERIIAYRLVVE